MEHCFDTLCAIPNLTALQNSDRELLQQLIDYYENGQWLQDYEADERGLLPDNLKRGVLAQDAVYELLERLCPNTEAVSAPEL